MIPAQRPKPAPGLYIVSHGLSKRLTKKKGPLTDLKTERYRSIAKRNYLSLM